MVASERGALPPGKEGICDYEKAADVGGQPNLSPQARLKCEWSLTGLADAIHMDKTKLSQIAVGGLHFGLGVRLGPVSVCRRRSLWVSHGAPVHGTLLHASTHGDSGAKP